MNELLPSLLFYAIAAIVMGSAAFTAFSSNLVHAAFSLLFTFFGMACLYIYLGADFVGISQIIIYVGGILVLLLFGVMFTGNVTGGSVKQTLQMKGGLFFMAFLCLLLLPIVFVTPWPLAAAPGAKVLSSTVAGIGRAFLTEYMLPFEIASLLLLVALIGAVIIARGEPKATESAAEADASKF